MRGNELVHLLGPYFARAEDAGGFTVFRRLGDAEDRPLRFASLEEARAEFATAQEPAESGKGAGDDAA